MAKKKKHPEHENLERWLVSYADFITLLFATFTALYAMAQNDMAKLKDVSEAIREGFQQQSLLNGIKTIFQGQSAPSDNPKAISKDKGAGAGVIGKYESLTYQPGEVKRVEEVYEDLKKDVNKINEETEAAAKTQSPGQTEGSGQTKGTGSETKGEHAPNVTPDTELPAKGISVSIQERGMKVSFDSRLLFDGGSANLRPAGLNALDAISKRLLAFNTTHIIHIEGHTDNQPIRSVQFPSNWELSAARSSSIIRYMISKHGFSPKSLAAVGYGDSRPIASNTSAEGRRQNRRVDFIIYSRLIGEKVNPTLQYNKQTDLIEAEARDENNEKLELEGDRIKVSKPSDKPSGPVNIIIKNKDGTERVLTPTHKKVAKPAPSGADHVVDPKKRTQIKPNLGESQTHVPLPVSPKSHEQP